MSDSPRTTHSEKIICKPNNYFSVTEKIISSKKQQNYKANVIYFNPGAHTLVYDDQRNIYLNKEYRLAVDEYSIECPGGAIEQGEEPLHAAQRELKEELGIEATDREFLTILQPIKGFIDDKAHCFFAKIEAIYEQDLDDVEHIERVKVSLDTAYDRIKNGKINEPISCYLIHEAYIKKITI